MITKRALMNGGLAMAFLFCAAVARGDYYCEKGYRDTSASERATMTRILEAARKTLPPAPQGWVITNDDPPSVPSSLCMDFERKPWSYGYGRHYQRIDKQAEIDEALQSAAVVMQEDQARKKPRMDALQAKVESLSRQQVAFMEKGDMNRALALNEQMASLQEEIRKVMDEGDGRARSDRLLQDAYRDIEMSISVRINAWGESGPGEGEVRLDPPAGAMVAFRRGGSGDHRYQAQATVIYGSWRPSAGGHYGLVARGHVPANMPHALSVQVDADEDRISSVLTAIDFPALANLVAP